MPVAGHHKTQAVEHALFFRINPLSECGSNAVGQAFIFALDLFGDKWTVIVLRDLVLKHKHHYQVLLKAE